MKSCDFHNIPPLVLEHWHLFCTHVVRVDEGQDDQVVVREANVAVPWAVRVD